MDPATFFECLTGEELMPYQRELLELMATKKDFQFKIVPRRRPNRHQVYRVLDEVRQYRKLRSL